MADKHGLPYMYVVYAYLSISPCPLSIHWTIWLPGSLQDDNIYNHV